jgi:hypothetical protein
VNHLWPELKLANLDDILLNNRTHAIANSAQINYQESNSAYS